GTHGLLGLRIDGNGMGREDRHAYRGGRNCEIWQLEDLPYLVDQFLFLAGVAVCSELVDMRNEIEGNLVQEVLRHDGLSPRPCLRLLAEVRDAMHPCPGDCLITRGHHALESAHIMQWLERHDGDDGRTIGAGDNAAMVAQGMGINFRDDQRYSRVHAERAG